MPALPKSMLTETCKSHHPTMRWLACERRDAHPGEHMGRGARGLHTWGGYRPVGIPSARRVMCDGCGAVIPAHTTEDHDREH